MAKPEEVKYTKTHEWIHPGAEATVGISDHAQHEMGDVVFVELPKVGQKLEKEKLKATADSLLALLAAKKLTLDAKQQAEVAACDDVEKLQGWLVNAATAKTAAAVFEATASGGH